MIKILFVCHGNICRSPMAEFLFKDYVKKKNTEDMFYIESAATSSEELGNCVHYGTRKILSNLGIDCSKKKARKIRYSDYNDFDYIIGMDERNIINLKLFFKNDEKISLLLSYAGKKVGISDPWYTGDFNKTYTDVMEGIEALYEHIIGK
mgnify:CR=1 FL=1